MCRKQVKASERHWLNLNKAGGASRLGTRSCCFQSMWWMHPVAVDTSIYGFIILKKKGYFGKVKLMEDDKESNRCSVWSWKHDFHSGAKMVN